jgi:WD40 repeat protein
MGDKAILVTGSYDHTLRFWDAFKEESTKYLEYGNDVLIMIMTLITL